MCKHYITHSSEMTDLEREALAAKFRKHPNAKHKVIFCHKERTMVIAANYNTPMSSTKKAIKFMSSLYKPARIEVTSMPRGVA